MHSRRQVAIHEAGHAVAHARLGIEQGHAAIDEPEPGLAGFVESEGVEHVFDETGAIANAIAYCAGYAALIASGESEEVAALGADNDFENAATLIEQWNLSGNLEHWKARAVELMRTPTNIRAVGVLADWLVQHSRVEDDVLPVLIELADGVCSHADFDRFLLSRGWSPPPSR